MMKAASGVAQDLEDARWLRCSDSRGFGGSRYEMCRQLVSILPSFVRHRESARHSMITGETSLAVL